MEASSENHRPEQKGEDNTANPSNNRNKEKRFTKLNVTLVCILQQKFLTCSPQSKRRPRIGTCRVQKAP